MDISSQVSETQINLPHAVPLFFHDGIKYNPNKSEITFSNEAIKVLQELVDAIQAGFPTEDKNTEISDDSVNIKDITESTITNITDAMLVAGRGKRSVEKFLEKVKILLQGKKKGGKFKETEKKVEKKVEKYKDSLFVHIVLQYAEGGETKSLQETPIIVRPGEDIEKMIKSLKARLKLPRMKK